MTPSRRARRTRLLVPLGLAAALTACGSTVPLSAQSVGADPLNPQVATSTSTGSGEQTASGLPGATTASSGLPAVGTSTTSGPRTSTSTGAQTTSVGGPAVTQAGPSAIAAKGRGWDLKVVHIGVTTTSDISTVGNSLGIHSINPGNLTQDAKAMVDHVNAHGGLFGRRVVPEFYDVKTAGDSNTVGQAICTHFTQDVPVIGLINMTTNGDTPNFDACIAKAHLPTLAWVTDTGDNSFFATLNGYYNNLPFPSWSRFAHPFVQRLVAQGYFTSWDTTVGGPGKAPVKVGLLEPDAPQGRQIAALLIRELKAVGHAPDPNDVIFFNAQKDLSSSEVKYRADGVTHVIGDELLFLFMQTYESQHYRPRYGINSSNAPSLFLEGTSPAGQLVGSMGVGVTPTIDVFASRDPGVKAVPGMAICDEVYKKAKVSYPADQRYAHTNAYGMCDAFRLLVSAAQSGGGLSGELIKNGLGLVGGKVAPAMTFNNGFTGLDRGLPGAGRDLQYVTSCSCYKYTSGTYPL